MYYSLTLQRSRPQLVSLSVSIKIAGLEQFGDVEMVRKKLMNTEKQKVNISATSFALTFYKFCHAMLQMAVFDIVCHDSVQESTKDVSLVQESSRRGKSGTLIYDIEYELDSTRGRKRILSSVGIAQKKLFIVNGNLKCDASGCTETDSKDIAVLRQIASTFDVV